jgi:uncharacterized protein (DUF4415 family)
MTAQPPVRGITGLLDGILSPSGQPVPNSPKASQHKNCLPTRESASPSTPAAPIPVRRGRPPGNATASSPKEKVTVWITSTLIADYREWTWEARCQLSHLVERALADYRRSCSTGR